MTITDENKMIAKSALEAFGGKPNVFKYWDDKNISSVDMLATINRPYEGVASYSTIGISDYSTGYSFEGKPLKVEIAGSSDTKFDFFPNILSTCAFHIINAHYKISYGEIFKDVVNMYYPDSEMEHILFTSPFLWENLKNLDFPDKKVAWLLAVPISTKELELAKEKGTAALEMLFEEKEIDIFDLKRSSIL